MNKIVKRTLLALLAMIGLLIAAAAVFIGPPIYRAIVGLHRYETVPPALPGGLKDIAILIFSKTNGYRHDDAITAGNDAGGGRRSGR